MAVTVRGFQPQEEVSYSVIETPLVQSGTTLTGQAVKDFIANVTTATGSDNNCKLNVAPSPVSGTYTLTNNTPSICSVDGAGNVSRLINGVCSIDIASSWSKTTFTRSMLNSVGGVSYAVTGYATGSLTKHVADQIAAMVAGKTSGGATQQVFNGANYSPSSPAGTRNAGLFSGALDLAFISYSRSNGASAPSAFPVQLISGHHFICASHVAPAVGNTVVWLDNSNVFHTATVISTTTIAGANDVTIGYIKDSTTQGAITGITPAYFLPSTWKTYLPSVVSNANAGQFSMPVLCDLYNDADGQRRLNIIENYREVTGGEAWTLLDNYGYQVGEAYNAWSSVIQGGDSSSPVIIPVNDGTLKTVLLCSLYLATGGASYSEILPAITTAMQSLAQAAGDAGYAGYVPLTVSLAGFGTY